MDPCHTSRPRASRPFVIAPYRLRDGQLVADMPAQCVRFQQVGEGEQAAGCKVGLHARRVRKTGPGFALFVAKCRTHQVAFTLYPPGHVPYGRVAVAPVDLAGAPLYESSDAESECEQEQPATPVARDAEPASETRSLAWAATLFRAAQDGAQRLPWPRGATGNAGAWRTQGRWLALGAVILGLTSAAESWQRAGLLGISALTRREASAAYADARGYQGRGRATLMALAELSRLGARIQDLLLCAGHTGSRWGPAWRWDPRSGRLREITPHARAP